MQPVSLRKRAFEGLAQFLVALAAFLFLPAWSLRYWQGWVFWFEFSLLVSLITVYFLRKDPALIGRRLKAGPLAEKQNKQKIIQWFANFFFVSLIVFPGLDHHFGWSHIALAAVVVGNAFVALGLGIVFLVFRENSYASGTIEVGEGQTIVTTGPYRLVRHPMYSGAILLLIGIPLALGSLWGLLVCVPMVAVIVWRLVDEEKYLSKNLPVYDEYRTTTRYRLVPRIY